MLNRCSGDGDRVPLQSEFPDGADWTECGDGFGWTLNGKEWALGFDDITETLCIPMGDDDVNVDSLSNLVLNGQCRSNGADQLAKGHDSKWSEAEYVSTALTDAYLVQMEVTSDCGQNGTLQISSEFMEWSRGTHRWNDDAVDDHPYFGCDNDRMSHVPKGELFGDMVLEQETLKLFSFSKLSESSKF